jgi:hypothetical protein
MDIDFLSVDDVLLLHGRQLARYGGAAGVRDARAIDAAVAMPRATFDGDLLHARRPRRSPSLPGNAGMRDAGATCPGA